MNTEQTVPPARSAATTGLAIVGFVALIIAGLWLAVWAARLVPSAVGGIGAAATYLGSAFSPAPDNSGLAVVPSDSASTTLPFSGADASTTPADAAPAATTTAPAAPATRPATEPGSETTATYGAGGTTAAAPHGLPDLAVAIEAVGYANTTGVEGFVASPSISASQTGAVKFRITNVGTNYSGTWSFTATLPTSPATTRTFPGQISLAPGDSIEYVLDFSRLASGDQAVSIIADPDHTLAESNENNNSASAAIKIN